MGSRAAEMPSDVTPEIGFFDRFATWIAALVGRATFFLFCVLLVVIWVPSVLLIRDIDTWQLIINTATTIITFLMVALLQNTEARADNAVQHKLNAIAQGLSDLMTHHASVTDSGGLVKDRDELRQAVGLEQRESSSKNTEGDNEKEEDEQLTS